MKTLLKKIREIIHTMKQDPDEAYLSQATDVYDLEHRQKMLDQRYRDDCYYNRQRRHYF